ncbi:MAG: T9SS type A sorting domain-containing protein [candidate division Zixibacteria bacterium]|nr:T9SS type A sorting domain-containing protein [candidate division Zixibacteria bacterium]
MSKQLKFQLWIGVLFICTVPAHATIHNITVGNNFISPLGTTVMAGDSVRWTWQGGIPHTIAADVSSPKQWNSGQSSDIDFEFVLQFTSGDGPGPFPYRCLVHPTLMIDTIFVTVATDVNDDLPQELPDRYSISQNYPNPFNLSTTIRYTLPTRSKVTISIYNIMGQKVNTIVDGTKSAGSYTAYWNGTDKAGKVVSSGVYFYRLHAEDFVETKRMLLLK